MNLSLQWRWFFGIVGLLLALLLAINLSLKLTLPPHLTKLIRADLARNAELAAQSIAPQLDNPAAVQRIAQDMAARTRLRLTVVTADGQVLADTGRTPPLAELLARPEIVAARAGGVGHAQRGEAGSNTDHLYVAVPGGNGHVVRVALPLTEVEQTARHVQRAVAWASISITVLALPVAFLLARRITQPLRQMCDLTRRVAGGDLTVRMPTGFDGELASLATGLNTMAAQLETRLRELNAEKAELHATLANMAEGVLVVDAAGTIRLANRALQRQLNVPAIVTGRSVLEVFRNSALQEVVAQALAEDQVTARELTFAGPSERVFEVNATRLRGPQGQPTGAVIVLHDITRIETLENMRKDFVANVSHELRTPLSIIKGYVETLLEDPRPDGETADSFLRTIQRHSARLETLIGDLLTISALESPAKQLSLTSVALRSVAEAARDELRPQAVAKQTRLEIEVPSDLPMVPGDPSRLHQVFLNLLDNAVKYTPPGSRVTVTATEAPTELIVCVADNGPGISPEHLDRVFERFYRVDKARSRDVGGTGLGLSIVKHIIQAHRGRVWAESELEKGSRFYFTLPKM